MDSRFERALARAERIIPLLSHLAQVGLFLLTAWGLFYTVIPLYQKAAVDEQVVKQQAQLTNLSNRLRENYVKNRRLTLMQFSIYAGPACSGLLTPVRDQPNATDKDFYSEALGIDVEQCLQNELQGFALAKELKKPDQDALSMQIQRIGARIDRSRLSARVKYDAIKPTTLPSTGPVAMGRFDQTGIALMKQLGASDEQIANAKRVMLTHRQQGAVVNDYLDEFRRNMLDLTKMKWPPLAANEGGKQQ